jgi:hypothetical protein
MELKLKVQEKKWRERWSVNAYDEYETWNEMVSNIRHKVIEEISKKILSKSMRISTKKWQRHAYEKDHDL